MVSLVAFGSIYLELSVTDMFNHIPYKTWWHMSIQSHYGLLTLTAVIALTASEN